MGIDILDRDMYRQDPFPTLTWIRNNHPVFRDEKGMWVLSKHADIRWAERQPALFSNAVHGSRPNGEPQPSMIDADDPEHARQRRIVARGFTPRQMQAYAEHVRVVATALVDRIVARGECDIVADIAKPLPMTLIGEMLGAPEDDYLQLQSWSDRMIDGSDGPHNITEDVMNAALDYYGYISNVIEERKASPGSDLVSQLITASEDDTDVLDDAHVVGNALLLLVGGNETTRNVIAGGIEALIRHPEQMQVALSSDHHFDLMVEEALRWVTPIINMNRTTTQDIEVRDVTIPAGSQVLMHYMSANRDEEVFDRPMDFDVSRDPNPHISFGWGPHLCLGANLARLELRSIFSELLTRLKKLRFATPEFVPEYSHSSFVRGIRSLPVVFDAV